MKSIQKCIRSVHKGIVCRWIHNFSYPPPNDEPLDPLDYRLPNLRSEFGYPNVQSFTWFPGHMYKTTKELKTRLRDVDFVLEIRDARIPFSSRNEILDAEIAAQQKRRMIIFNKADLSNANLQSKITRYFEDTGVPILFTNAKDGKNIKQIIGKCLSSYNITKKFNSVPYLFMILGMPNTGKSSIINSLRFLNKARDGKYAAKGPHPGVTRNISSFSVCKNPACNLLDTPGVMIPKITSCEQAFKLAVTGAIKDNILGEESMADFILYNLNRRNMFEYAFLYNLKCPSDDIEEVLTGISKKINAWGAEGEPDLYKAAVQFVRDFREGKLGRITLDEINESTKTLLLGALTKLALPPGRTSTKKKEIDS